MTLHDDCEYHPFAACLMFKACEDRQVVLTNLRAVLETGERSARESLDCEQARKIRGYQHHLNECEQIAGKALGYPWYKDDQKNFPGATEADGVCVGEHVGDSIVEELARAYERLKLEKENG
jgi:hypothetical protein